MDATKSSTDTRVYPGQQRFLGSTPDRAIPFTIQLARKLPLAPDSISLKQVRWSWLPRDEVAHARVDNYGVEIGALGGQSYSSTVFPTRVILGPSQFDRAEEMRDAINAWAGTTDPTPPPVNDPPAHDWSHRTGPPDSGD